ncbi:MAG: DUF3136 domain-containing protein [Aphanocapsa feldmannii 277cV]|uniref:DUF3136 domain-containing protein n=2 Tax=Aphanocapsa feldmannii TaxID=192050 RepID=A0A524RR80_9CHRO|nr:MAG: DUF3136 domain-containing protein [Aphanocapsa feldmannii 288cV]TGG96830.1 MAG: DUF3136 domain-containing protein [Aphanocapsa feldmannii 277cV]TGH26280.1 MAG: DUF3136 domain-containing protein [Aphanocapsa feldmannii 277cI]
MNPFSPEAQTRQSIAELESKHELYCKAFRLLLADKVSLNKMQKTLAWHKLQLLHEVLPNRYRSPLEMFAQQRKPKARRRSQRKDPAIAVATA